MGTGNNMGFSPNYNSAYLQEQHKIAIEAIAARYNTNDRPVAFVQIGSLGQWGELHTWPYVGPNGETNYTGTFPTNDISNKYVQHYINAFAGKGPNSPASLPLNHALQANIDGRKPQTLI